MCKCEYYEYTKMYVLRVPSDHSNIKVPYFDAQPLGGVGWKFYNRTDTSPYIDPKLVWTCPNVLDWNKNVFSLLNFAFRSMSKIILDL